MRCEAVLTKWVVVLGKQIVNPNISYLWCVYRAAQWVTLSEQQCLCRVLRCGEKVGAEERQLYTCG